MTDFVTQMANAPITANDEYANRWHKKYGAQTSRFWGAEDESLAGSSLYLSRHRFP